MVTELTKLISPLGRPYKTQSPFETHLREKDVFFPPVSLRQSLSWVFAASPVPLSCGIWPANGRHKNGAVLRQNHFFGLSTRNAEKEGLPIPARILKENNSRTDNNSARLTSFLADAIHKRDLHSQYALLRFDYSLLAPLIQSFQFKPHALLL